MFEELKELFKSHSTIQALEVDSSCISLLIDGDKVVDIYPKSFDPQCNSELIIDIQDVNDE